MHLKPGDGPPTADSPSTSAKRIYSRLVPLPKRKQPTQQTTSQTLRVTMTIGPKKSLWGHSRRTTIYLWLVSPEMGPGGTSADQAKSWIPARKGTYLGMKVWVLSSAEVLIQKCYWMLNRNLKSFWIMDKFSSLQGHSSTRVVTCQLPVLLPRSFITLVSDKRLISIIYLKDD